jgi:hypothetical protein
MSLRRQTMKSPDVVAIAGDCARFRSFGGEARLGEARLGEARLAGANLAAGGWQLGWRGYSETWRRT